MTDNECIAVYIMGWTLKDRLPPARWVDKDGCNVIYANSWRPDTDPSQAMQVVEAMRAKPLGYNIGIYLIADGQGWHHYEVITKDGTFTGVPDTLESAIHAAAVQVARAMEERDAE